MSPIYSQETNKKKSNNPYAWQSGDTTTFAQQSQNLANQAGTAGLNTGQIDVQKQMADAQAKAAQSAENVAQGASKAATGASVDPTMAQAPQVNSSDVANPTIQPYQVTKQAPDDPDTNVTSRDIRIDSNMDPAVEDYLNKLFNGDIPDSIRDQIDSTMNDRGQDVINPAWMDAYHGSHAEIPGTPDPIPKYIHQGGTYDNLATEFQDYLNNAQNTYQKNAMDPAQLEQFQNYIKNKYSDAMSNLNTDYQNQQTSIGQQKTDKEKGISDYIDSLNKNFQDYQDKNSDLSNIGQQSDVEKDAIAQNALLASPGASGVQALSALTHGGVGNSRLAALTQQASNATIQDAMGKAFQAQVQDKNSQGALLAGQKAQDKAFKSGKQNISDNQQNQLNKLNKAETDAQKQLQDAYNFSKTNLNNQEQDYVNKAQDTLKNAKIPEASIKGAVSAFSNTVNSYLDKGNLSDSEKQALGKQLESIWRISVGSNPSDIAFSDQIAGQLAPLYQKLGYTPGK